MNIQRASLSHQADAHVLLNEYYEAAGVLQRDTAEAILVFLADPASALWIAYVEGVPAGCVVLRPLPSIAAAAECKRLYVRPSFRGLGIASTLLTTLEDDARAAGLTWIYLDSKDDLQNAIRLYRHRGYETCDRFNDNPQATVFLRKRLQP